MENAWDLIEADKIGFPFLQTLKFAFPAAFGTGLNVSLLTGATLFGQTQIVLEAQINAAESACYAAGKLFKLTA